MYQAAEEARLPKRLRIDLGGALREFTKRESHCFAQSNEDGSAVLFTSQERQWLVLQILQSLRAGEADLEDLQGKTFVVEGQSVGNKLFLYFITNNSVCNIFSEINSCSMAGERHYRSTISTS